MLGIREVRVEIDPEDRRAFLWVSLAGLFLMLAGDVQKEDFCAQELGACVNEARLPPSLD